MSFVCEKHTFFSALDFYGFSGVFEGFSQNAEKENCKFEAQKYKSVFEVWYISYSQTTFAEIASSLTTETQ